MQSDINNAYEALGMKQHKLLGGEYNNEASFRNGLRTVGGTTTGNPPLYLPYQAAAPATAESFKSNSYALKAQEDVELLPKWPATLGARRDEMDAKYSSATSPQLHYGEWSTRAALSFLPM